MTFGSCGFKSRPRHQRALRDRGGRVSDACSGDAQDRRGIVSFVRLRLPSAAPRSEILAAALVTGALATFFALRLPPHGDASAHLFRTFLVRRGDFLWDNYWYGGEYPLASYSLLYYLPAALLGNTIVAVVAAVAASVVFAIVSWEAWGADARWAARLFAVFAVEPLLRTEYPFALAVPLLLASLGFLRSGRARLGAVFAALTLGVSPLAFAFLCLAAAGLFLARPKLDGRTVVFALALAILALCGVALARIFATPWSAYPFPSSALARIVVVSGLGIALARATAVRWNGGGIYAVWGLAGVVGFLVPTPIGANLATILSHILAVVSDVGSFFGGGSGVTVFPVLSQFLPILLQFVFILTEFAAVTITLAAILVQSATVGTDDSPVVAKIPSIVTNILAIALRGGWYRRRDSLAKRKQRGGQQNSASS